MRPFGWAASGDGLLADLDIPAGGRWEVALTVTAADGRRYAGSYGWDER